MLWSELDSLVFPLRRILQLQICVSWSWRPEIEWAGKRTSRRSTFHQTFYVGELGLIVGFRFSRGFFLRVFYWPATFRWIVVSSCRFFNGECLQGCFCYRSLRWNKINQFSADWFNYITMIQCLMPWIFIYWINYNFGIISEFEWLRWFVLISPNTEIFFDMEFRLLIFIATAQSACSIKIAMSQCLIRNFGYTF